MARITCDDCLTHVDNRYELVHLASERVRQLINYSEPLIDDEELEDVRGMRKDKETVIALREIAANLVTRDNIQDTVDQRDSEGVDIDHDEISSRFEEVDRQIEEEKRQAEEKEKEIDHP